MRVIRSLRDVVDWNLCIGCGACYFACDQGSVTLRNIESEGIRPEFGSECARCSRCLSICPGYQLDAALVAGEHAALRGAEAEIGQCIEIWEGWATDEEIRHQASSGGLLSALSLYCLEKEGMEFVLHSAVDPDTPWLNRTHQSRNRAEILARTASRYATSSPCDGLGAIQKSAAPCVFIGKPCDAAAVMQLSRERPELAEKIGVVLTFFCAGTPSTGGTLALLARLGAPWSDVKSVRYRGEGWPGDFSVRYSGDKNERMSYEASWAELTSYRPLRCNLCPDGLGRISDIACGDGWHRYPARESAHEAGVSVVLVRTPRGRDIVRGAIRDGYVRLEPIGSAEVVLAQKELIARRPQLFGRFLGMKLVGMPTPRMRNFLLFKSWWTLSFVAKIRSVVGTVRRMIRRGYWRRRRH